MLTEKEKNTLLSIFTRICQDETNYFNSNYANGNKLYIDGCVSYLTDEEKELVKKFMFENNIADFYTADDDDAWTNIAK